MKEALSLLRATELNGQEHVQQAVMTVPMKTISLTTDTEVVNTQEIIQ
jgi:hypothetical protein